MLSAYHPTKDVFISYTEYLKYTLTCDVQDRVDAPMARCPVCYDSMFIVAGKKKNDGHFRHKSKVFCPTKISAAALYENLKPSQIDPHVVKANKEFVRQNINSIWCRLKELVPYLNKKEVLKILIKAKELNIYGYANLNPELIVYIYVNLINFLPKESFNRERQYKFLFFFEANDSNEDLWINRGQPSNLIRLTCKNNEFIKKIEIDSTLDYLNNRKQAPKWLLEELLEAI